MGRHKRVIDADYYEEDDNVRPLNKSRSSVVNDSYEEDENDRVSRGNNQQTRRKKNADNANNNLNGIDLNNIDFSQISSLLQNVDMSQLASMLSGFGGMGGLGNLGGLASNLGGNEASSGAIPKAMPSTGDKRLDLLSAIRPMVGAQRSDLIDVIIQLYTISRILKR